MPSPSNFDTTALALRDHFAAQKAACHGARPKWWVQSNGASTLKEFADSAIKAVKEESAEWEKHSLDLARDSRTTGARLRTGWLATLFRDTMRGMSPTSLNPSGYVARMRTKSENWRSRPLGVLERQVAQLRTIRTAGGRP